MRFLLLAFALTLCGCATKPLTSREIEGKYSMRSRYVIYAGNAIELRNGKFEYSIFTDVADDPRLKSFPVRGRYTLEGSAMILHFPKGSSRFLVTRDFGTLVLWTPEEREQYIRNRHKPDSLLYRE